MWSTNLWVKLRSKNISNKVIFQKKHMQHPHEQNSTSDIFLAVHVGVLAAGVLVLSYCHIVIYTGTVTIKQLGCQLVHTTHITNVSIKF